MSALAVNRAEVLGHPEPRSQTYLRAARHPRAWSPVADEVAAMSTSFQDVGNPLLMQILLSRRPTGVTGLMRTAVRVPPAAGSALASVVTTW
jgi:hypothetical protein